MFRKKREIDLSDGRIACVQHDLSREINQKKYGIAFTVTDFERGTSNKVFFNGKKAFSDRDSINARTISHAVEKNLRGTSPVIVDYIKNYSHQDGFLNLSESRAKAISIYNKKKGLIIDNSRYDFIRNADGSVTFTERFYVDGFRDIKFVKKMPETSGRPVAIVVTRSIISLNQNKIVHTLDSDKIILLDKLGEELFGKSDGVLEYQYQDTLDDIEGHLNAEVSTEQHLLKIIDGLNQECEKFKEQLIGKMASILAKKDAIAGCADRAEIQDCIKKYLSGSGEKDTWTLYKLMAENQEFNLLAQQFELVESSRIKIQPDDLDSYKIERWLRDKITTFSDCLLTEENKNIFKKSEDGLGLIFLKKIANILTFGQFHEKLFRPTDQTLFSRNIHAVAAAAAKTGEEIKTVGYEPAAKKAKY